MKLLALISGGKDSIFSILCAQKLGHKVVMLGHLYPPYPSDTFELDSFMYQTVGHHMVHVISKCMEIPIIQRPINGKPVKTEDITYTLEENDEVEDLFRMIEEALEMDSEIAGILSGAIASKYQKKRIQHVCQRLGLETIEPLWERDQRELLKEMIDNSMHAIVIKTCCLGLNQSHLGKSIEELYPYFLKIEKDFGFNVCGEGGEYESFVLDCPLYKRRIVIKEYKVLHHTSDPYAPTLLFVPTKWELQDKFP
ncbi:bifunctional Diphthamide synthase domain/Diphthine--ammonia ligase-Uncharacterized protein MJ0570/Rossmann-like alpha-beta-alpha sandwich fold [Babesia duncani]|uniref:Diphthine--ammonia ligase n=1 Tax=Babesia duncani TaxID=323732 RepID=A0AAD9UPA8_9APIC|nr:bifunctional Diphthamide synthase domain/Diphthine--ammonia ligase-Uncharacterized protein MJ0570/Rossmann-like alpha-beta-alpha sandwich fold [Babesia duncani]